MQVIWARLASFCHLGLINDPLIISKCPDEPHDHKGQENKTYTIVKSRETFYRRHTVPITLCSEVKYVKVFVISSLVFNIFVKIASSKSTDLEQKQTVLCLNCMCSYQVFDAWDFGKLFAKAISREELNTLQSYLVWLDALSLDWTFIYVTAVWVKAVKVLARLEIRACISLPSSLIKKSHTLAIVRNPPCELCA